jgi:GNAT superfamily N-acetyltransferase
VSPTIRREAGPPEVVRAIADNLRSFWTLRAEPSSAQADEIVWWTSGAQRRSLNGVLALTAADPGPVADRIAATFRLSGLPCAWLEGPDPASPELGLRLLGLGYRSLEASQGWALPLTEARQTARTPPGLLIRHGREPGLVRAFVGLVGEGALHLSSSEMGPLEALLSPREGREGVGEDVWLALEDGVPVAGLLSHRSAGSVGLFSLATVPERRGQGFATALVLSTLRSALDDGYSWGVAEAPESHAGPYRRLGFQEYCDFRRYGWEPHPAGSDGV